MKRCCDVYWYSRQVACVLFLGICVVITACGPPQAPLVRDFDKPLGEVPASTTTDSTWKTRAASTLEDVGWTVAEASGTILSTEPRTLSRWGVYRVDVYVELVSMGSDRVRLFWQPYRMYATGGRSKIPYMPRKLRRTWEKQLTAALEEDGFRMIERVEQR